MIMGAFASIGLGPRRVEVLLSTHAIERFNERVRPGLDYASAAVELARLVLAAELSTEPPTWLAATQAQRSAMYAVIGDLVLPLDPSRQDQAALCALTCLARGSISSHTRERRTRARKGARGRRGRRGGRGSLLAATP